MRRCAGWSGGDFQGVEEFVGNLEVGMDLLHVVVNLGQSASS
jgi:hypothetical protein